MRVALDTNILAYAEGIGDAPRCAAAIRLIEQLHILDALIVAVAAENRCRILLSEDLQAGFTWRGVTVVNPFAAPSSPLLASLIGDSEINL